MHLFKNFGLRSLAAFAAAVICAGGLVAQPASASAGSAGPQAAPAQTSPQQAPADPSAEPATPEAAPQSFTVQPVADNDPAAGVTLLHTTVRRVVVDVVVTGPDGKPVPDLTEQDFTVEEDRKPQSVRGFEAHTPESDRNPLPPAPAQLPSHIFVNLEPTPASGPLVVVLIDQLNTPLSDQAYAHEQIVRFLEKKPAATEVAIFALADHLSMVQGFTTDTAKLLQAMRSHDAGTRISAASEQLLRAQITLDAFTDIGRLLATQTGRKNLLWFSGSFEMLVLPKADNAEGKAMIVGETPGSPNPGPGPVVTSANMLPPAMNLDNPEASSSGFVNQIGDMTVLRERMRKVAAALAVSQTAVYPIDVRGLVVDTGFSASAAGASPLTADPMGRIGTAGMPASPGAPPAALQAHNDFMQSLDSSHSTMQEIAAATGGQAFVNTNGIALAANQAITSGASYYTIIYKPSNTDFDGGLRSIHVTLNKPGCHLSYRSAYYAVDPATVSPEAAHDDTLAAAVAHGAPQAQGLIFKAKIDPDGTPATAAPDSPLANKAAFHPAKKPNKTQTLSGKVQSYSISLAILTQQLSLPASPDGRHHAALEIAVYAYAADGQVLGGTKQNLQASMPPVVYNDALKNGMYHTLHVDLPVEAASLRLAIVDAGNHQAGSLEVALPLPPAQQAEVAMPTPAAEKK